MAVVGSGQGCARAPGGRRLWYQRGHHGRQRIETGRAEGSKECGRRQPIKITKISTPVQDHRQAGRLELHQEADALSSHVEEGGRSVVLDREHGRQHPLLTWDLPQEQDLSAERKSIYRNVKKTPRLDTAIARSAPS